MIVTKGWVYNCFFN